MNNYFATNLKYLLKLLRISQEELAFSAKVRTSTISNYINQKSVPGIEEFVEICQYFKIPADNFLFQHFEKSNLITETYIQEFKQKGNLKTNLNSNLIEKKVTIYEPHNLPLSTVNEGQETLLWSVLNVLKQMDGKLDVVRASVEELNKKKP